MNNIWSIEGNNIWDSESEGYHCLVLNVNASLDRSEVTNLVDALTKWLDITRFEDPKAIKTSVYETISWYLLTPIIKVDIDNKITSSIVGQLLLFYFESMVTKARLIELLHLELIYNSSEDPLIINYILTDKGNKLLNQIKNNELIVK